jgi:hypothetical protein
MNARSRRNDVASVESLMIKLLMKFLMPSRWSSGSAFQRYLITPSRTCSAKNLVFGFWLCSRIASARGPHQFVLLQGGHHLLRLGALSFRDGEKGTKCQKKRVSKIPSLKSRSARGDLRDSTGFARKRRGVLGSGRGRSSVVGRLEEGPANRSPEGARARVGERDRARTIVGSAPGV